MEETGSQMISLLLIVMLVMLGLAALVIFVSAVAMQRISKERDQRRLAEIEHQRELLTKSFEVQENERMRIAAELHDGLSSKLSIVRLGLYQEENVSPALGGLVDEAIEVSRLIAHDLYPPLLAEFGLTETLRDHVRKLHARRGVSFVATGTCQDQRLGANTELHLFRITQELIHNALKHAQAQAINVILRMSCTSVSLLVSDDGRGFDSRSVTTGWGMKSLQSRVRMIGAIYRIASHPGRGTNVLIFKRLDHEED